MLSFRKLCTPLLPSKLYVALGFPIPPLDGLGFRRKVDNLSAAFAASCKIGHITTPNFRCGPDYSIPTALGLREADAQRSLFLAYRVYAAAPSAQPFHRCANLFTPWLGSLDLNPAVFPRW